MTAAASAPLLPATLLMAAHLALSPAAPFSPSSVTGGSALAAQELPVRELGLANGMTFLLLPRPGAPTVSFVVHLPVGSVNEALGSTGTAHFVEHLLFKGSGTVGTRDPEAEARLFRRMDAVHDSLLRARGTLPLPDTARVRALEARLRVLEDSARAFVIPNHYDEILAREGARGLNAGTGWESTEYHVELPANRMELWFALESDRMRDPVFREFYTERDVIAEERRARVETSPSGLLYEAHVGAAFRVHPYGVLPIGHMDDILALSRTEAEAFYRRHYTPGNTVVAIVGNFDADSAAAWAERYFGDLPPRDAPPPLLVREPEQRGERRVEVVADAGGELRMGWKVPSWHHEDTWALAILSNLLVAGRDARLYRRLVRDEGVAAGVSAGTGPGGRYPGLFTIHALPEGSTPPEALEPLILDELTRLAEEPPTPLELERVRTGLEASRYRRLTSNLGLAFQLAESQAFHGDWRETFRAQEKMAAVAPEDVSAVVRRYFRSETLTVGILRPRGTDEDGVPDTPVARDPDLPEPRP